VRQISFTLLVKCYCDSNSAQYERNRRFRPLVHVCAGTDPGVQAIGVIAPLNWKQLYSPWFCTNRKTAFAI